jgi:hypothetical protein
MNLGQNPYVKQALQAALEAGVPQAEIERAFAQATAQPVDPLTEPVLSGRLYALARQRRSYPPLARLIEEPFD